MIEIKFLTDCPYCKTVVTTLATTDTVEGAEVAECKKCRKRFLLLWMLEAAVDVHTIDSKPADVTCSCAIGDLEDDEGEDDNENG